MFFSVDDEVLKKKFLPYFAGVTDSIKLNDDVIAQYFASAVLKKRWWTREFNIFRRSHAQVLARSYKLNGFFMWHIV
jgi:hypothetical protein